MAWLQRCAAVLSFAACATSAVAGTADPTCAELAANVPFTGVDELRGWHQVMADLGPRPTGSTAHRRFMRWLRKRLRKVSGLELRIDRYRIDPIQLERSAMFDVVGGDGTRLTLPTAGPIPYAKLTGGRGVEAPLVHVPNGQAITSAHAGKLVVRDFATLGVPYAVFKGLASFWYDPRATLASNALYERETLSHQTLDDVRAAAAAGAAGLVMIHEFPRAQVEGQYQPYRGELWPIPGVFLGVDEGRTLLDVVQRGSARGVVAVRGTQRSARTWNLIATLPGNGRGKIVVGSHTDGMNPIWDNGPLAMLALARHFASLPSECRPRTLELAFTSAHLHLAQHGAKRYAESLRPTCDTVSLAVVLEHLGANEFLAVPRTDGPGRVLVPSMLPELTFVFATPSEPLLATAAARVAGYDLQRTAVVPFTAGIANGEGKAYDAVGLPTLAVIAAPWTLRNPAFGMETVDVDAMRTMTLAFRDMISDLQDVPRAATSGGRACQSAP